MKVDVEVTEEFVYDIPDATGEEAMARNNYEIFLEKQDDRYYVVSANISTEVDPVDGEFNVNEQLGYSDPVVNKNKDLNVLRKNLI